MLVSIAGSRLSGQTGGARPAIVVVNLRFDGEHANVLQASDTAVVAAATSKLPPTPPPRALATPTAARAPPAAPGAADPRTPANVPRPHPPPPRARILQARPHARQPA